MLDQRIFFSKELAEGKRSPRGDQNEKRFKDVLKANFKKCSIDDGHSLGGDSNRQASPGNHYQQMICNFRSEKMSRIGEKNDGVGKSTKNYNQGVLSCLVQLAHNAAEPCR